MNEIKEKDLRIVELLGKRIRWRICMLMKDGKKRRIGEIVEGLKEPEGTLWHSMRAMMLAGIIERSEEGNSEVFYRLILGRSE